MSKTKLPAWLPLIVFLLMSGEAAAHTTGNVSYRDAFGLYFGMELLRSMP